MSGQRGYVVFTLLVLGFLPGAAQPRDLDASRILPATGTIEFAFTPGSDAAALVIEALDDAKSQVLVQAFSFTHREIAAALIRAHQRGLEVQVIADASQIELIDHNVVPRLLEAGVSVLTDSDHASAHNKVMILDAAGRSPTLITGSFNFTFSAQHRNAENLLVFRGNRALCSAFLENWKRHRSHSVALRTSAPSR